MIARAALALTALGLIAAAPGGAEQAAPGAGIGMGYQPVDKDERGLWMEVDELERRFRTSAFVIRDPSLNDYVRNVFCRMVDAAACQGVRIYLVRTAEFNASMAPTGMMMVNTGLLLRVRNEAQLAAVLGHEYAHFMRQHSLRNLRDMRGKANALAWLSALPVPGLAGAAAMGAVQFGLIGAIFRFSRAMESEADAGSVPLMVKAGYDPREAEKVWEQLRAEQDATAAARHTRSRKNDSGGLFATHPPSAERIAALHALAVGATGQDGREAYRAALAPWWPQLVDDQVKLNDTGATDFLLTALAHDGWTADLLYARGELYRARGQPADMTQAAGFYREAIALPGAPAEAWRGAGLVALRTGRADEG
uniref:M48 family metallopeptidase n=1 Tax=uncultured Sphingomonas sp. TaxID=158754 RepID=UPI0026346B6E